MEYPPITGWNMGYKWIINHLSGMHIQESQL
jgi:hypothetical protein